MVSVEEKTRCSQVKKPLNESHIRAPGSPPAHSTTCPPKVEEMHALGLHLGNERNSMVGYKFGGARISRDYNIAPFARKL